MLDLLIRNARLVDAHQDSLADVAIAEGKIVTLGEGLSENAKEEVDATGLVLFAGGIDPHVHFNEPGRNDWEGIATGSAALAKGGYTSFFDMPLNSSPVTTTVEAFHEKQRLMAEKSLVNAYLWAGLVPDNLEQLEALHHVGAIGFKAFMSNSGIDEFEAVDDYTLYRGMEILAPLGQIVALHAENDRLTSALAQAAIQAGRTGIKDYLKSRPAIAEVEAIQRAILFASETGCQLHIVHVSTGRGIEAVLQAQADGIEVTCETCPHYLVLTEEDVERIGAAAKCAPPIRSTEERDALWRYLMEGKINFIASDHSPAPMDLKMSENFFKVWGGIASCQSSFSLMLTEGYHKRGMSLQAIAATTSHRIAQVFNLKNKGLIQAGYDADLSLIDIDSSYSLRAEDLAYQHKISPYIGMELRGIVHKTWVKGNLVYDKIN